MAASGLPNPNYQQEGRGKISLWLKTSGRCLLTMCPYQRPINNQNFSIYHLSFKMHCQQDFTNKTCKNIFHSRFFFRIIKTMFKMLVVFEYPTWQPLASNATSALDWAKSQPADPSFQDSIRSGLATSQPGDPSLRGNIRSGIGPSQPGDPSLRGNIRSGMKPSQTVDLSES